MGYLQKEGLQPNPEAPKTILDRNSAYKIRTAWPKYCILSLKKSHLLNFA